MLTPGFSYAQARLQARISDLPQAYDWQHLASEKNLSGYLEEARSMRLKPWVGGFSLASNSHDIERGIRRQLRIGLQELVAWTPLPWRSAVAWSRWLIDLPVLSYLLQGQAVPTWLDKDPDSQGLITREGMFDPARLRGGDAEPLLRAWAAGESLLSAWLHVWRSKWPPVGRRSIEHLERVVTLLQQQRQVFLQLEPDQAWAARDGLRRQLWHLFHRYLLEPTILFVYLALLACDLERLRSDLITRALFPVRESS